MNSAEQLMRDEGCVLHPYRDSVGKLTIGYGHNLDDKPISKAAALQLLWDDIQDAHVALHNSLPWFLDLDEVRQAVLVNMCFNLGIGGVLGFHNTLALIQAGKYAEAAANMLESKWAAQVGKRAERLALQMASGQWQ